MMEEYGKYLKAVGEYRKGGSKDKAIDMFRGTTQGILIGMASGLMVSYFKKWNLLAGGLAGGLIGGFLSKQAL